MHFYQFHIGDYQSDTRHLELLEDLAYRRMLDLYYKTESPLPLDTQEIARLVGMRSHCDCIEIVLHDFFVRTESGWKNNKADEVLAATYTKSAKASASAKARWAKNEAKKTANKQALNANAMRTHSEGNADGMLPITHNPLPITHNKDTPPNPPGGEADSPESKPGKPASKEKPTKQKTQSKASDFDWSQWPALPDQQILSDWFAMRKEKRAKVSQTVVDTFGREVTKAVQLGYSVNAVMAECVTRGWQGFKVEWLSNQTRGQANAPGQRSDNSAAGRVRANIERDRAERARAAENRNPLESDVIDVWPPLDE